MLSSRSTFLLLLLSCSLSCLAMTATTNDGFDGFDGNHDGAIDREEFRRGVERVQAALSGNGAPPAATRGNGAAASALKEEDLGLSFWPAFVNSLSMILATEIGDKTFFIAAVMSMRNDRAAVFAGAILALICMTILSSLMGLVLPALIPRQYTHIFGGILFLYFGVKLIVDARSIPEGKCSDELEEVEEELNLANHKKEDEENTTTTNNKHHHHHSNQQLEEGSFHHSNSNGNLAPAAAAAPSSTSSSSMSREQVFVQALTLTFLAEWGDRSQIATIALATHANPLGVTVGAIAGHSICTGIAVVAGRWVATKVTQRTVAAIGGTLFMFFAVHAALVPPDMAE